MFIFGTPSQQRGYLIRSRIFAIPARAHTSSASAVGAPPTDSNCADHLITQLDDNAAGSKEHSRRRLEAGLLLEPFSELPAGLKIQHRRRE